MEWVGTEHLPNLSLVTSSTDGDFLMILVMVPYNRPQPLPPKP
jgi:hypothetical protein